MKSCTQRSLFNATSSRLKGLAAGPLSSELAGVRLSDSLVPIPFVSTAISPLYRHTLLVTKRGFILDRQRWVRNAYSRNGIYGPKDKKKLSKEDAGKALAKVEKLLAEAEKDPHGPDRGYEVIRKEIMHSAKSGEKPPKKEQIHNKLCALLFRRHALRHERVEHLSAMEEKSIAQSFLGMDSKQVIPVKHAKLIIEDLWFKGKSPLLEKFARDDERIQRGGQVFT